MAQADGETLLDVELIPDPDQMHQLGPTDATDVLRDDEAKGCRLTLVRRQITRQNLGHGPNGTLEFDCSLLPARGLRFVFAHIVVQLMEPSGAKFVDVAPTTGTQPGFRQYGYTVGGTIFEIPHLVSLGKPYVSFERSVNYRHHIVRGAGGATNKAEWRLEEDPVAKAGLDTLNPLFMTIGTTGKITGRIGLSAEVARTATLMAMRRVLLGTKIAEQWRKFEVDVPIA